MKLYIDNLRMDLPAGWSPQFSLSSEGMNDLTKIGEQRISLELPMSPANRRALGFPEQFDDAARFNHESHPAEVYKNGALIFSGTAELLRCETVKSGGGSYRFDLVRRLPEWLENARLSRLADLEWKYEANISDALIRESWTNDSPIKFFPVYRDRYEKPILDTETPPIKLTTFVDYHPFVHVRTLAERILSATGYRIESDFFRNEFFDSLFMSGHYPSQRTARLRQQMDFLAGRFEDVSVLADKEGIVYANSILTENTIQNLVTTADPYEIQNGKRVVGAFDNGNCFRTIDNQIAFVPGEDVYVGFEYRLRYRSDFSLLSETERKGFTQIQLDDVLRYVSGNYNPLVNMKNSGGGAGSYVVVVFNYEPDREYLVELHYHDGTTGNTRVGAREQQITADLIFTKARLFSGSASTEITDWALYRYDSFIEATEQVEIDVTLRSACSLKKKNQPHYFSDIRFMGADPGAEFTLLADTTIRPIFYAHPVLGSSVTFPDLFAHTARQSVFLQALAHLFDLRFYTDERTKTVYVEPHDVFFRDDRPIDWTEKLGHDPGIRSEEMGDDRHETEIYAYADGDGAVTRWNRENDDTFARSEITIRNRRATRGSVTFENPFFTATIDGTNLFPQAWNASVVTAGDRDSEYSETFEDGNLNFPPKIVRYLGVKTLPEGELWGWPSDSREYPLVMFHSSGEEHFTLCFDDYEGETGLKHHYDSRYRNIDRGKRLTIPLYLSPSDVEAVLFPNSLMRDFRGKFVFDIRGEKIACRLLSIQNYDPENAGPTDCVFIHET